MLNSIRNSSNNFVVKFLLSLIVIGLILSFSDFFSKQNNENIAIVDDLYISKNEFNIAKNNEINKMKNFLGDLNDEQLQNLNFDAIILRKLINTKLIEREAKDLDIIISDRDIVHNIKSDQMFFNEKNEFDKEKFTSLLHANNLTEQKYVELLKIDRSTKYLTSSILDNNLSFNNIANKIEMYNQQTRNVDLIKLKISDMIIDRISEENIEEYYNNNKIDFLIPEKRSIDYIKIDPELFSKQIKITDNEITEEYNKNKVLYNNEESRDIYSIIFKDQNDAKDFINNVNKDYKKYTSIYKSNLIKQSKRSDLPIEFQEIVFSLPNKGISDIIETEFGYNILIIDNIKQSHQMTQKEASKIIYDNLNNQKSNELLSKLIREIEDEQALGSDLLEIGQKFNLPIISLIDIEEDRIIEFKELNEFNDIKNEIFGKDMDYTSGLLSNSSNDKYVIIKIKEIKNQNIKNLDDVSNIIKDKISIIEKSKKARDILENIKENYKNNNELNLTDTTKSRKEDINHHTNLLPEFIEDIYSISKGDITAIHDDKEELFFAIVTDIVNPVNIDEKKLEQTKDMLELEMNNNLSEEYLNYLYKKHKVKIYN